MKFLTDEQNQSDFDDIAGRANARLNQMINEMMGGTSNPAPYRYYQDANENMYCWTLTKVRAPRGNPKYATMFYRYYKGKQQWQLKRTCYFATKKKAKARALEWLNKHGKK